MVNCLSRLATRSHLVDCISPSPKRTVCLPTIPTGPHTSCMLGLVEVWVKVWGWKGLHMQGGGSVCCTVSNQQCKVCFAILTGMPKHSV